MDEASVVAQLRESVKMSNVAAGPRQEDPLQDGMGVVDSMPAGVVPLLTTLLLVPQISEICSAMVKQSLGNFVVPVTRFTHPQIFWQNSSSVAHTSCSRLTRVN